MGEPRDYRSFSYRLIGRIHACRDQWAEAADALRSAIEFSPDYPEALYEYAQYCVRSGDRRQWLSSLRRAILANPAYWYMSWAEGNFAPVRKELAALLKALRREAREAAERAIGEAEEMLQAADWAISRLGREIPEHVTCARREAAEILARCRSEVESGDYQKLLAVPGNASEAHRAAEGAIQNATCELKQRQAALRESANELANLSLGWSLGALVCCLPMPVASVICGVCALKMISRVPDREINLIKLKAIGGVVLGSFGSVCNAIAWADVFGLL